MNRIVSHEVSKFGRINIAFHHHSTTFYNVLEENGIIDYLKNLDHLGFISKSNPGNNHKRWDYVMLQLFILHKLKDGVFRTGLGSNQRIDEHNQTSGIVILQIAVLFANIGHLSGTLASEVALLEFLETNPNHKAEFLSKISLDASWLAFANNIIDRRDLYKMKYLVALNFLLKHCHDDIVKKIILLFFQNSLINDEPRLRKLKSIFHKVRQISFIYLDSFNSDFAFQIDITKVLLNPFNNKTLFNPNSFDYESFFDSCETALTKKLYITQRATTALEHNKQKFYKYLSDSTKRTGANKLQFENLLCSLFTRNVKPFEVSNSEDSSRCLQFYLSKEDLELFGMKQELFNYEDAQTECYKENENFTSLLNKNLTNKTNRTCFVHDGRKTLFFNNLILKLNSILETEQNIFLKNYFNVHAKYLNKFEYVSTLNYFKTIATINLRRHYSRKVFLQVFKVLFNHDHDLSAYIKFDYHQLIKELSSVDPSFHATGYIQSKASFIKLLDDLIDNPGIPADLKNNHRIAKYIVEDISEIERYVNVFYSFFPIEIDKYALDPSKLYNQQNPESATTLTDIDLAFAIFNAGKLEFYIIEGKNLAAGFQAATNADFEEKIKPNLRFPNRMPAVQIVNQPLAKGGYICYKI